MTKDSKKTVDEIIKDLSSRQGLDYQWYQTKDEVKQEIRSEWQEIIENNSDPKKAADKIIGNLSSRQEFDSEWKKIDEDIKDMINKILIEIIKFN